MQYGLRTLLIVMTVLCVLFALVGRYGGYGLAMRVEAILFLLSPLAPISELLLEAWLANAARAKTNRSRPMPRYKLRTLLIALALGPPVLAVVWWEFSTVQWKAKVTDAGVAFAMVVALIFTYVAACLVAGFLVACVIIAINWLIAKLQGH